ncbi:DsrE family protein [Pontibacter cellulosilyticus]|uniref:DoxX family membrane protein n=1 Tax=Pontibacter cellulosilyticus TaxID=1720253 RepID=A0A923NAK1_9BACT|nr:DoxX family membrane protein [Pontibacter cellulosilyticus]MBC5994381.1 DoxX family membrane protein [Pontibacter cellulosilyticus]
MEITPKQKISFLVLRIMASLIFIVAGISHFVKTAGAAARLENAPFAHLATWMAPAETLIILSGIGLLLGGFMLLAGYKTKLAAAGLLAILIPITLTVQVGSGDYGPLFKNVALTGVLIFFIVNGAVHYGLDQAMELKKRMRQSVTTIQRGNYAAVLVTGLLLLGSCASTTSVAQSTSQQDTATQAAKKKYAVLISQPNHLKAAVNTAETITKESKYNRETFVVMACGKSVEAFKKDGAMAAEIEKGRAAGVTYMLCGMSLKKFNIDPATLVEGIEITPNGLTYMFDLKQQGFITVEL